MELNRKELEAVVVAVAEVEKRDEQTLIELKLAMVGGGAGDVSFG